MMAFCKHCGKQITDDSVFCQYCGGKQDIKESRVNTIKDKQDSPFDIEKYLSIFISEKQKKYLIIYVIWVLIHIICWMFGKPLIEKGHNTFNPQNHFYPFTYWGWNSSYFNIDYYDGTEFLVYVLLIPLIVFFYIKYWHESLMSKIKEWKMKRK